MAAMKLNRTHRVLIGVVIIGALVIAAIGFAGSYSAVRDLAERKGFGDFAPFFPIGIDAGIVVLLALDLLLTWLRIAFPLLRQTAWLLTAATIAFNGAAAWPDPLGVGMHAIIPLLFVVSVEAARHAVGRIADITADKHMEGVRISRWLLAFPSTFLLWRRMKLWELRSYEEVIRLEQERLVYQARLRARYGRAWRRKAPVESLMPLKLAKYGIPLAETGPAGLNAAGITLPEPTTRARGTTTDPARALSGERTPEQRPALTADTETHVEPRGEAYVEPDTEPLVREGAQTRAVPRESTHRATQPETRPPAADTEKAAVASQGASKAWYLEEPQAHDVDGPARPHPSPSPAPVPQQEELQLALQADHAPETGQQHAVEADLDPHVTVPVSPGRVRALGQPQVEATVWPEQPGPADEAPDAHTARAKAPAAHPTPAPRPAPEPVYEAEVEPIGIPDGVPREEVYFEAYRQFIAEQGSRPSARQLSRALHDQLGVTNSDGSLLSEPYLRSHLSEFRDRYNAEMGVNS